MTTDKPVHLLCAVRGSGPDGDTAQITHALLEVTAPLLATILARAQSLAALQKVHPYFDEAYFWDGCPDWFEGYAGWDDKDFDDEEALLQQSHRLMTEDQVEQLRSADRGRRVECVQMVISVCNSDLGTADVCWSAIPKHCDIYIRTVEIPLIVLQKYWDQAQEKS